MIVAAASSSVETTIESSLPFDRLEPVMDSYEADPPRLPREVPL
jgi:hypothetical protein